MNGLFLKFRYFLAIVCFLHTVLVVTAQEPDMSVWGTIQDIDTEEGIQDAEIFVNQDEGWDLRYAADSSGYFEFTLEIGKLYKLTFSSEGYVTKEVEIHTQEVPVELIHLYSEQNNEGWSLRLDISLFIKPEGFRSRVMKKPIGKLHFNQSTKYFDVDLEYTAKVNIRIAKEFNRLEKRKKRREKKER